MPKKRMSINSHSMKEVEKYARFLLREAGADGSLPTPVPEIIECADLIVDQNVDLKKIHDSFISRGLRFLKSALGKLRGIIDLRENVIYIDMSVLPQRQDFIKLHESAHKVLPWQRELYQVLEDSNITLGLHTRELFEQQANQFAADVLFQVDRFEKEAKDLPLGIKSPILLSKRYGASCHAAIRRYVEKNSKQCALLIMGRPNYVEGNIQLNLWQVVQSRKFRGRFGKVSWPEHYGFTHQFTQLVCKEKRKLYEDGELVLVDKNGDNIDGKYHLFNNTYHTFVLVFPEGEKVRSKRRIVFR